MPNATGGFDVAVADCKDYDLERVKSALVHAVDAVGGLDFVRPGMRVAVKANLMMPKKPEQAATTHPAVAVALCELLIERGASVVLGDSPGGLFTAAFLTPIYAATGMRAIEKTGAQLNFDFGETEVTNPAARVCRSFLATNYLLEADAVVSLAKIKTHGLMAYTGACKNLFGAVPAMRKAESHYRYPTHEQFSGMLVDICEYIRPALSIGDMVEAMEGNGPSAGVPRHVGALFAAKNPHALDLAAAHVMNLSLIDVPTLSEAHARGLIPDSHEKLNISGDLEAYFTPDFKHARHKQVREWGTDNPLLTAVFRKSFESRPDVTKADCVRCGECERICPAHAIAMGDQMAEIDREACIRCFCCQEFCPKGAIRVRRPFVARAFEGFRKR